MAERVYRRKSTAGVTPLASGYTSSVTAVAVPPSPQGEGFGGVGDVASYNANTAGVPTANVAEVASADQTAGRVYRKKQKPAVTPSESQRVYTMKPEVKAAQKLSAWGDEVAALSKDMDAFAENLSAPSSVEESYNNLVEMLGRITAVSSSLSEYRTAYSGDADVMAYVDDVENYLNAVGGELSKMRETYIANLRKAGYTDAELQPGMKISADPMSPKYGQMDEEARIHLANTITANRMKNAGKYNHANFRSAINPTLGPDAIAGLAQLGQSIYNAADWLIPDEEILSLFGEGADDVKALTHDAYAGLAQINQSIYNAADWLILDDEIAGLFGVENKVGKVFDSVNKEYDAIYAENERLEQYANPTVAFLGDNIVTPTVQALPNLAVAIMSGGATAPAQLSAGGGSTVAKYFHSLANNPNFWLSFAQSGGGAYQSAKDRGATELEAQAVAWLTAFPSAMVEVRGGVEGIPKTEAGVWAFVKNAAEEGGEEVLQGLIENAASMAVFEQEKQWASFTDTDAFISLPRAAQEFIGGLTVGAVLGGGFKATQYAYQSYQYAKLGERFISGTNGLNIDKAIAIGMDNAKGTDAYNAAVKIQQRVRDGKSVSAYAVGRMVAQSQTEQAQISRAIERTVLSTAKEWNIPTDAAETVSAAAVSLGQKVEFVSPEGMHNRYMAGEYDSSTDTVRLNAAERNVDKLIGAVLAHEMVHTAEGTDQLQKLAQIAERMENHKNGAGAWEKLQADVKSKYAAAGKQLSDPEVKREALARWISENLFQNKAFAKAVADGDANVGNAFFYLIDRVRRAMGAKKASAGNLAMLERLFMQAIDARTQGGGSGVQYSLAPKDEELVKFYQDVMSMVNKDARSKRKKRLGVISETQATIIRDVFRNELGIERDLTGYELWIDGDGINHIDYRHGANGKADQTMSELDDVAKIPWVANNAQFGELVRDDNGIPKRDAVYENSDQTKAYQIRLGRIIDNNFFCVVECVPDSNQKRVYIKSAYKKSGKGQLLDLNSNESRQLTPEAPVDGNATDNNIADVSPVVNTQSMQEGEGISAQGALLSPESMEAVRNGTWREARAEGVQSESPRLPDGQTPPFRQGGQTPSVADGDTSLGEGGLRAVEVDEAAVLETAVRSGLQGKQVVDLQGVADADTAIDRLVSELGEEETLWRMIKADNPLRPTSTVEIDGQPVVADAYVDAYARDLPNDTAALERHIERLREQRTAQITKMHQEGMRSNYTYGALKIDLQLFAAQCKWDLLQVPPAEPGKKPSKFFANRLKGEDILHTEELMKTLSGREESYNPICNQKLLGLAEAALRDPEYQANLLENIGKDGYRLNAVDVAAATILAKDAYNDGRWETVADLYSAMTRRGTELGRAVQALSIIKKMTPEGFIKMASKTLRADADYAICEGADKGLDTLAKDMVRAIEKADAAVGEGRLLPEFEEDADFASQIDNWENLNPTAYVTVGNIPGGAPLHQVGMPAGKLYFDVSKLRDSMADHADHLSPDVLKQIPQLLKNPIAIVEYRPGQGTNTVNVYGDLYHNGTPITVGVVATVGRDGTTISKIRTMHARRDFAKQITDESILYLNENKKETDRWFQAQGQPVPMRGTKYGLIRSIANIGGSVNSGVSQNSRRLTRGNIEGIVQRAIKAKSGIPAPLQTHVKEKLKTNGKTLAQQLYDLQQKGTLNSETARRALEEALDLPRLTAEDIAWVAKQGEKVQSLEDKPVEQAEAMEELYRYLGAKMTVNGWDMFEAWRKFGMLYNIKTLVRNEVSNAVNVPIRKMDSLIATGIERVFVKDADQRAAAFGWSLTNHGKKILPTIEARVPEAVLEMRKQGAKYEVGGASKLKQYRKVFGKGKFGQWIQKRSDNQSGRMDRSDERYFKRAYVDALGQVMTARNATEVTQEMHDIAIQRALEATFRAKLTLGEVLTFLKRWQNSSVPVKRAVGAMSDIVIPFTRTPANIGHQAMMHSPIGLVVGGIQTHRSLKGKSNRAAAESINNLAKGITGTALYVIGLFLARWGLIKTGFGKSEKERAADEAAGIQENSFTVCGVNISFDWLQPTAAPFVAGAVLGEAIYDDEVTFKTLFGQVAASADSLFGLSMLQSMYDFFGGYEAGVTSSLTSIAENSISQSIPTLVGQFARIIDPVQRKTRGEWFLETALYQVMAKVPGLTYLLDPELDMWGNEVYRTGKPGTETFILNTLQQTFFPSNFKIGTGKGDPISQEILRLYEGQGGAVIPTAVTRDEAAEMGEDFVDVNRLLGGANRLAAEEFVGNEKAYDVYVETGELTEKGNPRTKKETKYYRDMTDDERRRVLSRIYKATKAEVTGDTEGKTESQLTDSERYIRELLRRVQNGERGTFDGTSVPASEPAQPQQEPSQQEDTSYYEDLLRRMKNGN